MRSLRMGLVMTIAAAAADDDDDDDDDFPTYTYS